MQNKKKKYIYILEIVDDQISVLEKLYLVNRKKKMKYPLPPYRPTCSILTKANFVFKYTFLPLEQTDQQTC